MTRGNTVTNAVIGAVVTILTTFLGVSPILGGAVAGYLNQYDGVKVGTLSGVIATIPFVGLVVLFGSLFGLPFIAAGSAFGALSLLVFIPLLLIAVGITVGLGALGGYLGVYLYEERVL